MWSTWLKATKYSKLPSEILGEEDSVAAWMFDNAVTWFGVTIENALQERVKVGEEYKPKYTLARLLGDGFKLPRPPLSPEEDKNYNPWSPLLAWAGKRNSGVKRYRYNKPVD